MKKIYSLEKESAFAISMDEIKALDNDRKLGLSGHLRVRNEPINVIFSIASCIDVLDELIITVQPFINESNIDETYLVCKVFKNLYSDKIKLFYYTAEVISIGDSHIKHNDEMKNIIDNFNGVVPERSIHNLAHYYNFGLTKISYKYYMKIDADQFYFTNKLQKLKNAILQNDRFYKNKRNIFHKILGKVTAPFYGLLSQKLNMQNFVKFCNIFNGKVAFCLGGINISKINNAKSIFDNSFNTLRTLLFLHDSANFYEKLDPSLSLSLDSARI